MAYTVYQIFLCSVSVNKYYNSIFLSITNMNQFQQQQILAIKMPFRSLSSIFKYKKIQQVQEFKEQNHNEHDDEDCLTISSPSNRQSQIRVVNKSMINRSCINTCSFSCRNIFQLPNQLLQFSDHKLKCLQKIDLSFNNIAEIKDIPFQKMMSLKELIVNDNQINEIPHHFINNCPQLIYLNFDNNQLTIIPALKYVKFLMAKDNNIKLITSELISLHQIEFLTFDWLEYLIDTNQSINQHQKIKEYTAQYQLFKKNILANIDYEKEQNNSYCDFNCYLCVRINKFNKENKNGQTIFSMLIGRAIIKTDDFFLGYLKHFHNDANFAKMTYNSHLLLQLALESNKKQAIEIFMLRKTNYAELIDQQVYFQSVKLCCFYSCYDFFKYLICIRSRKHFLLNKANLQILIKIVIQKFNKQRQGDKFLSQLMRLWNQIIKQKIKIILPAAYNSKIFKSMSYSLLQIYSSPELTNSFQIQSQARKTTPLHFAMRSKNEQLIHKLLAISDQNIFQKNYCGLSSKFMYGSTQISRKMVWIKQKKAIKRHWNEIKTSKSSLLSENSCNSKRQSQISSHNNAKSQINLQEYLKNRIGYEQFKSSLSFYKKPSDLCEQNYMKIKRNTKFINKRNQKYLKNSKKDEFLQCLGNYYKIYKDLTWRSNYKKKIVYQDILQNVLLLISSEEEDQFMLKLQKSQKMIEALKQLIENLSPEEQLVKYQMMQTIFMLLGSDENQKIRNITDSNFWCCQNVIYE